MTVLSRGARVRRSGRRPGWVLLTTLLVLAIGASSALVFTDRVELLKLAVILALWAAVAGAFVSVLYRRQADVDQARARDLKLVYDLQLDREISARREYELTVESQLRRELAVELRAAAADEIAALRAELSYLRTNLEILFDTDLEHRPALETLGRDIPAARALGDHPNGAQPSAGPPPGWVSSDRITSVRQNEFINRGDEAGIIDVPEVGVPPHERDVPAPTGVGPLPPPRQPVHVREYAGPPQPEPAVEPRHRTPPPAPVPAPAPPVADVQPPPPQMVPKPPPPPTTPVEWQPAPAEGQWAPPGTPGSNWATSEPIAAPDRPSGRRRRSQHSEPDEATTYGGPDEARESREPHVPPQYGGRRSRSRHSTEYRDFGVGRLGARSTGPAMNPPMDHDASPPPEAAAEPRPEAAVAPPPPPRLAPAPPPPRHRGTEQAPTEADVAALHSDGQSVADLMARLQVQPTGEGRRRRRDG